jgi:hypothetical protein
MERQRCNGCGEVYTADEPAEAGAEKYDATAAAMIAQLRYGSGVPFKRLERLEGNLGLPLPAAAQWGVAEKAALSLRPAYDEFIRQAALGEVMHNDDTSMRILRLAREPADPRTGVFTSGHGDRGADSTSWIFMSRTCRRKSSPKILSRSRSRYPGI